MATGAPKRVSERARAASEQAALQIIRVLRDSGFTAYLAGGCVRDVLLGLSPADYDVATSATPDQVLQLFDDAHEVGKAFGVVLVRFARGRLQDRQGRPMPSASVEIATFRREGSYSDKRRPDSVDFCGPEEDARRRDFTLNALFLDPFLPGSVEQQIIDTVGGLADLRDGIIRAVGDPEARLNEDHLRALRAVRFASRFGFEIEQGTAAAIRAHARCLTGVSNERVGDELRRMLSLHESVPGRRRAIHLIEDLQLGPPVLGMKASDPVNPESGALAGVVPDSDFPTTLIAWVHDREGLQNLGADFANRVFEERAHTLRRQLVLSNEELSAFRAIAEGLVHLEIHWTGASVAQRKRWASSSWFEGAIVLLQARNSIANTVRSDRDCLANDGIGLAPEPWVSGDDLIAAGMPPGPSFRGRLDRAYDAQLDGSARSRSEALRVALEDEP